MWELLTKITSDGSFKSFVEFKMQNSMVGILVGWMGF